VCYTRIYDELYNGNVIDIRSLPKGRSLVIIKFINYNVILSALAIIPRSVNGIESITPALPFVRSMGPNTRNVFDAIAIKVT
jgi:hypothetical protein